MVSNARTLAKALADRGYNIVTGGTDVHLFVVDLRSKVHCRHMFIRTTTQCTYLYNIYSTVQKQLGTFTICTDVIKIYNFLIYVLMDIFAT